ncbi:hypothetical protein HCN44_010414 [Aphidius gifuensis]|uniref:Uncharacterized protein n=1 Tax=Aphidius gifuensis TaxID=684658 RepID=A0A834XHW9_APHGI|nr:hypothetical protein HCN44_010414 [Aphidius gifuensis]
MDSGLGGGFQALLFNGNSKKNKAAYVNAREYSPIDKRFMKKPLIYGNSVGVPSMLAGYAKILGVFDCLTRNKDKTVSIKGNCMDNIVKPKKKNSLKYSQIFDDVIKLAERGFKMSPTFAAIVDYLPWITSVWAIDHHRNHAANEKIANFLKYLRTTPLTLVDAYVDYRRRRADLRSIMLADIQYFGSRLTSKDFIAYRPKYSKPLATKLVLNKKVYDVHSMAPPAGGDVVLFFLKLVETLKHSPHKFSNSQKRAIFIHFLRYSYAFKNYGNNISHKTRNYIINKKSHIIAKKIIETIYHKKITKKSKFYIDEKLRIPSNFGGKKLPKFIVSSIFKLNRIRSRAENFMILSNISNTTDGDSDVEAVQNFNETDNDVDNYNVDSDDLEEDKFSKEQATLQMIDSTNATNNFIDISPIKNNISNFNESDILGFSENPFGTSNIVIRKNKKTIVSTASINHSYGSGILSRRLGIFYNNQLRDFSPKNWNLKYDKSKKLHRTKNYQGPKKQPQSSMGCTVISRKGKPVFMIGAAGGFKITGAMLNVIWNYFYLGNSLNEAIKRPRLITKLDYKTDSVEIWYERVMDNSNHKKFTDFEKIIDTTKNQLLFIQEAGYSAVTAASKFRSKYEAAADPRRGGSYYIHT